MGNRFVIIAALILTFSLHGFAQSPQTQPVEEFAQAVAQAFAAGELGKLDAERPYVRTVRLRIEHSISGQIVTRNFRTLARLEQWLKGRERDEGPARNSGTLRRCRRGVCTFEQEGMLHNNLYLQRITYGLRRGRPYVKAIYLVDGD
ncbi:MAG TPA: hypothetical protein VJT74_11885 [Pyrinomonadaceae bacterium]|nr:hypothetical protein [Pyrinomonadaceae bacterium]